ncbi:MAG: AsmA family protein [Methylotenera sp.]
MNKIIKYVLYGIGGLTLLLALVAGYFAATFNPNDYKDDIIKLVKDKKERTLHIDGDIKLSFWPKIGANLGKLSISEHQSDTIFASVESVKVALAVMPLLKKELVVDTVYVDGAKANVVKYKDGKFNFDDLLSKDEEESKIKFDIDGVNVTNSEVKYTDENTGAKYNVSKFNMESGHIALAEPVDLKTDFTLTSNQPETAANVNLKGNFFIDPETKHFKVKGLDSHIVGDMLSGKNMDIKASGDVDAKPELMEFLVDDLKFVASGNFDDAKQSIDLSAPALTILKDEVTSKKVTVSFSQDKNGDVLKANMVLADMKGSPKALQSSGITGDLSMLQGKRTVTGTFSSPFSGNIQDLIFDIPKLAGNLDIKDPSLPNGGMKGTFNLGAHTDIKNELANSKFNLAMADTKLTGDVDVKGFKKQNIRFNLNADKLDLNKLLGKSSAPVKSSNKPVDMSALKNMTLDGKLSIGSLIYDKYRVSGLNVGIKADGDKLALSGLNVKVDDSQIKGNVGISNFAKPLYTFDLDVDSVDIDRYVKSDAPAKKETADKPFDLSALKTLNADGSIRVGSLKYGKTKASNINIQLKADGEKLILNPLSAKIDDSQIKGSFGITQFSKPKYLFDLDIDALDANKYAASGASSDKTKQENSGGLSGLKTFLADGNLRIGSLKYDKYQISNLKAGLKADGQKLQLNPFIAKIDDSQFNASLNISQFSNPAYNFDLKIDRLDADRYITKGDPKAKSSADTPIDLSALKKLNATGEAKIGWLKLANVKTENVNLGLKADEGVATLSPFSANLYNGSMAGTLKVDARATPSIAFKQAMKGVSVGPLMVDAINNDMLSGTGTINVDVTTTGNSVGALKKGLLGNASLNLADGAIKGVDIAGSIRDIKSKVNILGKKDVNADKSKKTDFSELTATFDIKNGVAHNEDLAMKAPVLRLAKGDSHGDIDIGNERINYLAKPTIVKSLKGQGGAELDDLSGIAIPVKITGTFADPKYGMDFAAIGTALAQSKLLDKVGGEKGAAVKELIGGDKVEGLKGLLGKKKPAEATATAPATAGTDAAPATPAAPAEEPKSLEDQAKEKAEKKLKKLLKF